MLKEENEFNIDSYVESIIQLDSQLEQLFYEDREIYFIKLVVQRLLDFGLTLEDSDTWLIVLCINKTFNHVKNSCNITIIPKELYESLVDRVCGEFLFNRKQSNKLKLDDFDFDMAVKTLQEGDTKIDFAINSGSQTDEQRITSLINYLLTNGEGDLICYRRLKW